MNRCMTRSPMCRAARARWKAARCACTAWIKGKQPACAEACPNKSILFGNLNDPESEISKKIRTVASTQIRADLGLNTGIRYQGI